MQTIWGEPRARISLRGAWHFCVFFGKMAALPYKYAATRKMDRERDKTEGMIFQLRHEKVASDHDKCLALMREEGKRGERGETGEKIFFAGGIP